jgi:hypothetical protein
VWGTKKSKMIFASSNLFLRKIVEVSLFGWCHFLLLCGTWLQSHLHLDLLALGFRHGCCGFFFRHDVADLRQQRAKPRRVKQSFRQARCAMQWFSLLRAPRLETNLLDLSFVQFHVIVTLLSTTRTVPKPAPGMTNDSWFMCVGCGSGRWHREFVPKKKIVQSN